MITMAVVKQASMAWVDEHPGMVTPRTQEGRQERDIAHAMYEGRYTGALYHATDQYAMERIQESGFKLPNTPIRGADYGTAIYFSTDRSMASSYGSSMVTAHLKPGTRVLDMRYPVAEPVLGDWGDAATAMRGSTIAAKVHVAGFAGVTDGTVVAIYDPSTIQL